MRKAVLPFVLMLVTGLHDGGGLTVTLRGDVTDLTGAVIPNASVGLYSADEEWEARADSAGRFEIAGVAPGIYELEVNFPGFRTRFLKNLEIGKSDPLPISVKLDIGSCPPCCDWYGQGCYPLPVVYSPAQKGLELTGFVYISCKKEPLGDTSVSLSKMEDSKVLATVRTDNHGEYRFNDLDPGRYVLKFTHEGYYGGNVFNLRIKPRKSSAFNEYLLNKKSPGGVVSGICP